MSDFIQPPPQYIKWKCPKCGHKTITEAPRSLLIMHSGPSLLSRLLGEAEPPICDKCGTKMKR
ncbi:MAG: hypothetical protein BWX73_02103 [Lentisphaerae bacterium ADurb.Bin082]|nr:MAG: hypothetical protein BWX73_02103 [Lentisphaerae bacterium ADurb.Bin082]